MASEKLILLLQSGDFDPDDPRHYQALLREWASGDGELRQVIKDLQEACA